MTRPHAQVAYVISEATQIGQVRRAATLLAREQGLDETDAGRLALVATEAASNVLKHARGGELLLRPLRQDDNRGVELLALDRGPGMADLAACFRDGYSTAGSPGTGLGAVRRLSERSDVYSAPDLGTALLAEIWARPPRPRPVEYGVVCQPIRGEIVPGDDWIIHADAARAVALLADGLGHGALAAAAAEAASALVTAHRDSPPRDLLQRAHAALRGTRGAAVAAAELDLAAQTLDYAGIGNVSGTIVALQGSRSLLSHNGTVGLEARRIQQLSYPFARGSLLVMHSDGLRTRWNLADYPGLLQRHPALIAGVLYRDFSRKRDDVTVLALREAAA